MTNGLVAKPEAVPGWWVGDLPEPLHRMTLEQAAAALKGGMEELYPYAFYPFPPAHLVKQYGWENLQWAPDPGWSAAVAPWMASFIKQRLGPGYLGGEQLGLPTERFGEVPTGLTASGLLYETPAGYLASTEEATLDVTFLYQWGVLAAHPTGYTQFQEVRREQAPFRLSHAGSGV